MPVVKPRRTPDDLARQCLGHLERAVRVDSQSDENSPSIPSTAGQAELAGQIAAALAAAGARVERDEHANVIASLPARHCPENTPPLALMVHLDTSRGTRALERLLVCERWDGRAVPYPARPELQVAVDVYPETSRFVGHDLVHGPGDAPFGLDDKLGLAQMLTLVDLLREEPSIPHPPLVLVARPDEEIGRMAAVEGLARLLAERGVTDGYTLDGLLPYEINVENFNASAASIVFPHAPLEREPGPSARRVARVEIGGVNTHGATARAEGYRGATRLAAELLAELEREGLAPGQIVPISFASDALRDCDATLELLVGGEDGEQSCRAWGTLEAAVARTIDPHVPRGAGYTVSDPLPPADVQKSRATSEMLRFVGLLLADRPGFVIPAEDSDGYDGYSAPYRALPVDGGVRLDVRLRDFDEKGLARRAEHVRSLLAGFPDAALTVTHQYVNMGPRLAGRRHLVEWPQRAAEGGPAEPSVEPIRGGTGVDPFLDHGVHIANLGTGYFAPESEKEFTSMQTMAGHVQWLVALVQVVAADGPRR